MKENLKKMRQVQQQKKDQKDKENKPKKLFKMKQFSNVEPTLKTMNTIEEEEVADPYAAIGQMLEHKEQVLKEKNILKAHSKETIHVDKQKQVREKNGIEAKQPHTKPSVPRKDDLNALADRSPKNFLSNNRTAVVNRPSSAKKPSSAESTSTGKHETYGKVPEYILERKRIQAEQEMVKQQEAAEKDSCPAGLKVLPESERLETLQILQTSTVSNKNLLFLLF